MSGSALSRRGLLSGAAALGGATLLGGCISGGNNSSDASGKLVLQVSQGDPKPAKALADVVAKYSKHEVTVNRVATESFRAQLPTYLNSAKPPDVLTWYAGSVARDYASKGLLLDVSELWRGDGACASFSQALKDLSSTDDGKQIFVPTHYYWWGIFYRKSNFRKWQVEPAENWSDFLKLCRTLKSKGVVPLSMGTGGGEAWVASGWFDYLNLRINGAQFHLDLLTGEHSFDSAEVRDVLKAYRELLPFIDPKGRSLNGQQAVTPLINGKAAMYLYGAFFTAAVPEKTLADMDFFRVPVVDEGVRNAEEAPTDGYFAAAKGKNKDGAKELLSYLAAPKTQSMYIAKSGSANIPTSPEVDTSGFAPLVRKGMQFLDDSKDLTQFFNRDSSDELQKTADTALTKFLDRPDQVDAILAEWQKSAERVRDK
ncbi:MAG: extracellular solute-binding protein [Streptosporangiales bacterium]|nr:extracellular solute-binding protein [Streptosporangiales bacterium]